MVCKNCGIANSDNSRFCSECGSALPQKKVETAPEKTPETEAVQEQPLEQTAAAPATPTMAASAATPAWQPAPVGQAPNADFSKTASAGFQGAAPVQPAQTPPVAGQAYAAPPPPFGAYQPVLPPQIPPIPPMQPGAPYAPVPPFGYGYSPLFKDPNASKVKWALGLGIASAIIPFVTFTFGSPISLILAIIALCLSAANLNKVFPQNRSKAIAGLVMGIIGIAISGLFISLLARVAGALVNSEEFKQFNEQFQSFLAFIMFKGYKIAVIGVKAVVVQIQTILKLLLLK